MFLVTDGTIGSTTTAIVVERQEDVEDAITRMREYLRHSGGDPLNVVVNPVGPAIW